MLDVFNTFAAGLLATVSGLAVMSPRVRCGLVAHVGLVMVSIGFFGIFLMAFETYVYAGALAAAQAFVHAGLLLCAIGYAQRTRRRGHQRRVSDWVERGR